MKRFVFSVLILFASMGSLFAYDPPAGGLLIPLLGSPQAAGYGITATALDAPWADRLNPAASAGQERTVLDFGYSALSDFGASSQGFGTALSAGLSIPKPYGVWGAGLRFVSAPKNMTELPLGTFFTGSGSIAKDLFPNFYVGAGLDLTLGQNGNASDWGLGLDLGFIHFLGDKGIFKDLRWGGALANMGKSYCPEVGGSGNLGSGSLSAYPSPFTLNLSADALLVKTKDWKIGAGAAFSFPSFQNLGFGLSGSVTFRDVVSLRSSWGLDLRELLAGSSREASRSLIPTFALCATIPISSKDSGSFLSKNGWEESELKPTLAVQPLYGNVSAVGAGLTLPLGVVDRKAPEIAAKFPASSYGPYYLSPNSDGHNDSLEIPVRITDKRYLVSYAMTIYKGSPAEGKAVRVIANKESRPENQGFKGLWARLLYVKKGVPVPEKLVWDGRFDSGEVASDGEYTVEITATDDNGNRGLAGPFPVIVDSTPPQIELAAADPSLIFSPDGDGNKDTIGFKISGSVEDLWSLRALDAAGKAIRTASFKSSAPADWVWDGRSDPGASGDVAGAIVPDGVYSLVVDATDRAGNSASKRIDNILVNTQQPPINVVIDASAFSPNGDGVKDTMSLLPSVPVKTGLASWTLSILDKDKKALWSKSGTDAAALLDRFVFDGRGSDGKALADGQYQAELAVTYVNGHSPKVLSPLFTIDTAAPKGTVSADRTAFNPAGSADQNLVRFSQTGSAEESWSGEVLDSKGQAVRNFSFGSAPDATVEWDGNDDSGKPVPDGLYSYRLKSTDRAGNGFASAPISLSLDTAKKEVRLSADSRAFGPNGDGQKDSLRLSTQVQRPETVRSYELTIAPADSKAPAIKTWKGQKAPAETYVWDGSTDSGKAPDGRYIASLKVTYLNSDVVEASTPAITLDTVSPSIVVSGSPLLFSPNGDGRKDSIHFTQKSAPGDDWNGRILASDGSVLRSWSWKGEAADFDWDGTDSAGNRVKDGSYRYEVASTDAAGNKAQASVSGIALDARSTQVFVTASDTGFSPNGDGVKDSISFTPIVNLREGIESWRFVVAGSDGKAARSWGGKGGSVPASILWDGKDDSGKLLQGEYSGSLAVDYAKGDRVEAKSASVLVDSEGPKAAVRLSPEFFSPDNDGVDDELAIALSVQDATAIEDWSFEVDEVAVEEGAKAGQAPKQRLFIAWSGKGNPASSITWDGRSAKGELVEAATDYPYTFTVRDSLGNSTRVRGIISVDVLVIRDGDRLKIKVPSIVFRANFADFNGLDTVTVDRNARVIKRIAQILNKFSGYKIGIEGHANSEGKIYGYSTAKIAEEEQKELLPLSLGRAELVRNSLVENGVDAKRLSVEGMGSSQPVVDFKDAVNRWKNRRVEFILYKN
jgi:outer membrane protein OmpA-like peptidoglycan-associated protein/flagellar hook assembly protein FlgD